MKPPERLAIFDLDYTLTRKGTWGRFVAICMRGRGWRWPELALRAGLAQALYKLGLLPRIAVKTQMMRVCMVGRTREELTRLAEGFAAAEVPDRLRPGGIAALERHREAGDRLMIASAAVDLIVAPIARRLGVEDWVATEFAWDAEGRLADHFRSPNCYGPRKKEAVERFYGGLKPSDTVITIYSDSSADIDLFTLAHHPMAVNPSSKLRSLAHERGWPVLDWNESSGRDAST